MTVGELKALLEDYGDHLVVKIACEERDGSESDRDVRDVDYTMGFVQIGAGL